MLEMTRQTKLGRGMTICVALSEDQILQRGENEPEGSVGRNYDETVWRRAETCSRAAASLGEEM